MIGPEGEEHWSITHYQRIRQQQSFIGLDVFTDAEGNINKEVPQVEVGYYF